MQYGFSQTDARADLYAAGVTFNEMLIGQHPSRPEPVQAETVPSVEAAVLPEIPEADTQAAGDMSERTVFPCVWKTDADGSIVPVPEFAEKLIQPQVKLQRTEGNESPASAIYEADKSVWHGGVQVLFSIENLGSWYYSASATPDGQTLTAATMSHVFDISKQFQ